jgi:hypothetical protein
MRFFHRLVRSVTRGLDADPHDLYYVRGIIGREVGLMFEGEMPTVDLNANGVYGDLRQMSKQQLLDRFHQYYTVEEVIGRIHTMLNNGAIGVENQNDNKNVTAEILNCFLDGMQPSRPMTQQNQVQP